MDLNSEICSKNYRKRQAAAQAMAGSGDKSFLPLLHRNLAEERNPEVKAAFLVAIGKLGSREDVETVAPFLDSDNNRLKSAAVKALTYLKDPKLRERVYPLLVDPDNSMISLAVKVLWNFDPEGLVARIKEMLSSPQKDERKAAVWALSELQYSVAKPLLEKARFDNSISVRFTANDILTRLEENLVSLRESRKSSGSREPAFPETASGEAPVSPGGQETPDPKTAPVESTPKASVDTQTSEPVGLNANRGQIELQEPSPSGEIPKVPAAARSTRISPDQSGRGGQQKPEPVPEEGSAQKVQQVSGESVLSHLDRGSQPTPISRAKAAFTNPKPRDAVPDQVEGLDLAEMLLERAEQEAVRTLSLSPVSFDELAELLDHRDPSVRIKVIKTFESSSNPTIIPALKRLATTERNSHVMATVVKALGILGSDDCIDFIAPHLRDPDPRVVANAIEGLSNHWSPKVAELIKPFLTASKPRVQASALLSFAAHEEETAMKQIEKIIETGQRNDRKTAVRLLGEIGSPKAVDLLQIVYVKGDEELQALAGQIINNVRKIRDRVLTLTYSHRKVVDSLNSRISELEASEERIHLKFVETEGALAEAMAALDSGGSNQGPGEGASVFDNPETSGRSGKSKSSHGGAIDAGTWRLLAGALLLLVMFQQARLWYGSGVQPMAPGQQSIEKAAALDSPVSVQSGPSAASAMAEPVTSGRDRASSIAASGDNGNEAGRVFPGTSSVAAERAPAGSDAPSEDNRDVTKSLPAKIPTPEGLTGSGTSRGNSAAVLQAPPLPGMQLSEENIRGLQVITSIMTSLGDGDPADDKIRQVLEFHLPRLQEFFYMGETFILEERLKNSDPRGALEELKRVRKYIIEGYILWDFQKGEWISPRED